MATEYNSEKKSKSDEDILAVARRRFALAEEATHEIRRQILEDWRFYAGEQWPEAIKHQREVEERPTPVVNKLLAPVRQICNDQRQNRPSIKVHPVDDKADVETAKIYQGIIRHIEQDSCADIAYDTAFQGAAIGGLGYWRINTQYVDPTSFEQEIKIEMIENPLSVWFDPHSVQPDGSDAKWVFFCKFIPKDDFVAQYKESKLAGHDDWEGLGDQYRDWIGKDSVRVAEYYYTDYETKKVYQLIDGTTVDQDGLEDAVAEILARIPQGSLQPTRDEIIVNQKTAKIPMIKWCKINGMEILERTEWPGRWIPIVPVYGERYLIENKRYIEGIIRQAKDPARLYNYWKATEVETITLAPKAPFIAAEGQIPPQYAPMWSQANKKSFAFLPYKPTTHEGHLVPPPQRNAIEPPIAAVTQAGLLASDDIKATTGIFDAALGHQSNETSGVAIQRRAAQAQTSNFHLIDNLTRSIRHTGRILVDLIPKIYDTARAARIIGEEGEQEIVRINDEFIRKGEKVHYKLGVGKYDVSVETGPSFATKRQEAASAMIEIAKAAPNVMTVAPDLFVKNLDIPGAAEIADRLKKTLPPGIVEDPNQKPLPPEVQAQMQQMSQMIEQLTAALNEANETIRTKRLELESREKIEAMKLETQILLEKMKQAKEFAESQVERQLQQLDAIQQQESDFSFSSPDQATQIQPQSAGTMMPGEEEKFQ